MFSNFDFLLLDDPDFKEDSVREELIVPLLKALGYSANGPAKIIRSKTLTHPFVYIGSKSHKVNIVPDYLLMVDENYRWVLEAKAPSEQIISGKNPEQAFSYAIHPEIRVFRYALCNGRKLVIFDINRIEPTLVVNMIDLDINFKDVQRLLSPSAFIKPHIFDYKPDFGLYLHKLGFDTKSKHHFLPTLMPLISKVEDDLYTFSVNIKFQDDFLAASFDFDEVRLQQLLQILPISKAQQVRDALRRQPFSISFKDDIVPEVNLLAELGEKVYSNEYEDYCPLIVEKFFTSLP
ncbi:type I restriction enzyme HsdR N-terminal domain-containing protein [Nostoc sp. 'Peltigera membranacea cyanobiont' N6]|uniref:type I restriction enzyme HsdR N-terminal domain-containing protein n=1 Tax=Nostoc sp. 'Peltigera membranacea cyanobiont' N6 TaxID=1261031 RepID=UPI000CF31E7A|nr:type I restriction enzyme HsdR N-terminal domain-containing protein [Nostoc sp. 'Peltigera membranacea cyanobiont' N6]AVH68481.1 type I restriction endonuclease HsdR N-terminal domain protein [Nostoc sp. 'Peltigera membranacea cyanobiont' N6]